jgi:hypothetical protein
MPSSMGNRRIAAGGKVHIPINKDVLFLWWVLFVLFHDSVIEVIGTVLGFLVGADGVVPLVPVTGYKSVMD